jgi:hypothetical protein
MQLTPSGASTHDDTAQQANLDAVHQPRQAPVHIRLDGHQHLLLRINARAVQ